MATFTVNTTDDFVYGNLTQLSLREAVNLANATTVADTIVFSSAQEGQTQVLTGGELDLTENVTLDGAKLESHWVPLTDQGEHQVIVEMG